MSRPLRTLLSLAVAAALLVALFRWGGLEPEELARTLGRLSPATYLAALALHLAIYALRAERFRQLMPPASRPGFGGTLVVSSAHNLAAYVLPAKTGEATFVVYMKGLCGVPGSEGLASLLVSRLLDLTVVVGSIALASLAIGMGAGEERAWLVPLGAGLLAVAALFGVLCARSRWLVHGFLAVARVARLDRSRIGKRLAGKAEVVGQALSRAGSEGRLLAGALISVPLWVGVFLFYAVLARGLGLGDWASLAQAAFGSGLAVVANLLPINGFAGFGTQETGWVVGFGLLGVPRDLALSTGVGVHLVQLFNVVLFGLLGHLAMGFAGPARDRAR